MLPNSNEVIEYYFQDQRNIRIYNNKSNSKNNYITVHVSPETTFQSISKLLQSKLFREVTHLRLFDSEGVEIYQEDLQYIKNQTILYATNKGEDFNPSQSFQEYRIIEVLGEGGFGKVMLGEHKIKKTKVAIKILDTLKVGNAQDIDMVFREADTLKALQHQNIVKVLNQYTLPNMRVVFVMEYCSGGELLQYLEDHGPLDEAQARFFFKQVADAIHYCHTQKVIHRDLKLENILLKSKESKTIKVIDFGIAGVSTNLNVDKLNAGSLSYMAPEILNGQIRKIGAPIDIWALGVILYCLVMGQLPFQGNTPQEVLDKIKSFQVPPQFSFELRELLSLIFEIDPNRRIKMIGILEHAWIKDGKQGQQSHSDKRQVIIGRESTKIIFGGSGSKGRILKQPTSILRNIRPSIQQIKIEDKNQEILFPKQDNFVKPVIEHKEDDENDVANMTVDQILSQFKKSTQYYLGGINKGNRNLGKLKNLHMSQSKRHIKIDLSDIPFETFLDISTFAPKLPFIKRSPLKKNNTSGLIRAETLNKRFIDTLSPRDYEKQIKFTNIKKQFLFQ